MSEPGPADSDAALLDAWRAEAARPFTGWDFSHIAARTSEEALPWDYRQRVRALLPACAALLDMGTGGGEFLSSLAPLPPLTCATEGYPPNIPVARERLEPLGITVRAIDEANPGPLPFDDATFDLVINRHEYYDPGEVWRVLRPGGAFITQQVGGTHDRDLNALLEAPNADNGFGFWTLSYAREQLATAGFTIVAAEESYPVHWFHDVGALVYHLKAAPWQIPDFSVERYAARLLALHRRAEHGIAVGGHYFLIVAEKRVGRGSGE